MSEKDINIDELVNEFMQCFHYGPDYVGSLTDSTHTDFYVYEYYIKDTDEIFYVGKGRKNRYKDPHGYYIDKINEHFDTGVKFVAKNLPEEEALILETNEMTRILNETNYCLVNLIIPMNNRELTAFSRCASTPPLKFETAPILYATVYEEHFFGTKGIPFDKVDINCLSRPVIIDWSVYGEDSSIVYGDNYMKYYTETVAMLEKNGSKILKSRYAKTATAFIYPKSAEVFQYHADQEASKKERGKVLPIYHLIDVWKLLKSEQL